MLCRNFMGTRNRVGIGLSDRPAGQHKLAESIPWDRFLGSLKIYKYRLCSLFQANPQRWDFKSFNADVFNLRSSDISPGFRFLPLFSLFLLYVSATQITGFYWSEESFLSLNGVTRDTHNNRRAQVRPTCSKF
jgi:hypothetical protein